MRWTHDGVVAEVSGLVLAQLEDPIDLFEKAELIGDLGIDSLGVMELIAELEDQFGLTITDAELRDVATFGDVVVAVESRLREKGELSE